MSLGLKTILVLLMKKKFHRLFGAGWAVEICFLRGCVCVNLKYHIVSLIAVFCALGIGIFVGSNLVGNDFVDQQKQLVTSWRKNSIFT